MTAHAVLLSASDRPGMLNALTKVFADHQANITYVDFHSSDRKSDIYFEFTLEGSEVIPVLGELERVPGVQQVRDTPSFSKISSPWPPPRPALIERA